MTKKPDQAEGLRELHGASPGAMRAASFFRCYVKSEIDFNVVEMDMARRIDREMTEQYVRRSVLQRMNTVLEALKYAEIELRKSSNIETRLMVENAIAETKGTP